MAEALNLYRVSFRGVGNYDCRSYYVGATTPHSAIRQSKEHVRRVFEIDPDALVVSYQMLEANTLAESGVR